MVAFAFTALLIALVALIVHWIAASPVIAMLRLCFASWAEASRPEHRPLP